MQAEKRLRLNNYPFCVRWKVAALLGQLCSICGGFGSLFKMLGIKIKIRRLGASFSVDSIGAAADERSSGLVLQLYNVHDELLFRFGLDTFMVVADNGKNLLADNVRKQRRFCHCQPFCLIAILTVYRYYCYQFNCYSILFHNLTSKEKTKRKHFTRSNFFLSFCFLPHCHYISWLWNCQE